VSVGTGVPAKVPGSANILRLVNEFINISTNSDLVHQRVRQWIELEELPIKYVRLSPDDGLGSIPLDCCDEKLLFECEGKSKAFMQRELQLASVHSIMPLFAAGLSAEERAQLKLRELEAKKAAEVDFRVSLDAERERTLREKTRLTATY